MTAVTASEARRTLFPLIEQVIDDRSAANARRLLDAYEEHLAGAAEPRQLDRA